MRWAVEKPKLKRQCLSWKFLIFFSFVRSSFLLECAVGTIVCDEVMLTLFVCLFVILLFFSIWLIIVSKSTSECHLWLIIITIIVECQECEPSGCGLLVHDNARVCVELRKIIHLTYLRSFHVVPPTRTEPPIFMRYRKWIWTHLAKRSKREKRHQQSSSQ